MSEADSKTVEFKFRMRSDDPSVTPQALLRDIDSALQELSDSLRATHLVETVTLKPEKAFPLDPSTIFFTLAIAFGTGVVGEAGKDIYKTCKSWLQKRLPDASIKDEDDKED
jgi:hypothetical protein